jgi:acetoin utilization protein AcuB
MLVEEIMKREVITLPPNEKIETALHLLHKHRIRHIPIVNEQNEVIGIISDRDVRDASPSIFAQTTNPEELQKEIKTIMSTPVITVHPLDFIEDVASIFYEHSIACVPVTENNKLIGIVTEKDILYTLIQLTGIHEQSSKIEIKVENKIGMLPKITKVIGNFHVNISSVLVYPCKDDETMKIITFRLRTLNPLPILQALKDEGFTVLWPNMPGINE